MNEPGFDVTVYELTSAPPSENGSDQDSVTEPLATASIVTSEGADGTVEGTISFETSEAVPLPDTFTAATVKLYEVPLVRPVTVHKVDDVSQTASPAALRTTYLEIAAPPLFAGAVQDTTDWAFAAPVAETAVGTPGTVEGTTEADAEEAEPVPDTFVAVTVNEYDLPLVRPETVHEVEAVAHVNEPGFEVTVYSVIAAPPLDAGAVQETSDSPLAFDVPDTDVGAPATLDGKTAAEADEAEPVPDTFVAVTVNE
jgi:hypothetical protein